MLVEGEQQRQKAPRNRTLQLSEHEAQRLDALLLRPPLPAWEECWNQIICADSLSLLPQLPAARVDLLFLDPPYNLPKTYASRKFARQSAHAYAAWLHSWAGPACRLLKPTGSLYLCGDWQIGTLLQTEFSRHLTLRNRITWEREKGRAAARNWKNAAEDIWFFTASNDYYFDAAAVRIRRRVLAPYRTPQGQPKDWQEGPLPTRDTAASNLWTDLTVPFWSMPENTDHPTQKPEKLLAKLLLASCPAGGLVADLFGGAGTTAAVATKLGRQFLFIEQEEAYCHLAARRLELARQNPSIQGYEDGVFWERNAKL